MMEIYTYTDINFLGERLQADVILSEFWQLAISSQQTGVVDIVITAASEPKGLSFGKNVSISMSLRM